MLDDYDLLFVGIIDEIKEPTYLKHAIFRINWDKYEIKFYSLIVLVSGEN